MMDYILHPRRVLGKTGHILKHLFLTTILPQLGQAEGAGRPNGPALPPAYKLLSDDGDLIVYLPSLRLAIVEQFTDDPVLGYQRVKLARMSKINVITLDFTRPGGATQCEVILAAPLRSGEVINCLNLWIGEDGRVALVPDHQNYHHGIVKRPSYRLNGDSFGTPVDAVFSTDGERGAGIVRAIEIGAAAPAPRDGRS